jgi:hypothetical protein
MNPLILRALNSIPDECYKCMRVECDHTCPKMDESIKNFAQNETTTQKGG